MKKRVTKPKTPKVREIASELSTPIPTPAAKSVSQLETFLIQLTKGLERYVAKQRVFAEHELRLVGDGPDAPPPAESRAASAPDADYNRVMGQLAGVMLSGGEPSPRIHPLRQMLYQLREEKRPREGPPLRLADYDRSA